ncbi:MAG: hypothetical protein II333_03640 [Clostridia bacterium]|nr:hypothetical protein [Clostridia bacterium]
MKKYIAFLLAALMLSAVSCSSGEAETEETAAPETEVSETVENVEEVPEEPEAEAEEPVKHERPADVEVIEYKTLELEKDPVYDRAAGLFALYFTDHELLYPADAKCSVGLISDEEAISVSGTPDMEAYPDMFIDDDDFCGIAIKVNEEIPAGDYFVSVTFDRYIVNFDYTVQ